MRRLIDLRGLICSSLKVFPPVARRERHLPIAQEGEPAGAGCEAAVPVEGDIWEAGK